MMRAFSHFTTTTTANKQKLLFCVEIHLYFFDSFFSGEQPRNHYESSIRFVHVCDSLAVAAVFCVRACICLFVCERVYAGVYEHMKTRSALQLQVYRESNGLGRAAFFSLTQYNFATMSLTSFESHIHTHVHTQQTQRKNPEEENNNLESTNLSFILCCYSTSNW